MEKLSQVPTEKWSIQTILNEYLLAKFNSKERVDYWRGSEMGRCFRFRFYNRKGETKSEEMTFQQMRKLETGNIFHWYIQRRLEDLGVLVEKELELKDEELRYQGHCDAIVNLGKIKNINLDNKPDNWFTRYLMEQKKKYSQSPDSLLLYDFKTIHSLAFTYLDETGSNHYHYKMQLASYLYFAQRDYPELKEGRILFISKDDLRVLEVPLVFSDEWKKRVLDELKTLNDFWERGELPDRIDLIDLSDGKPKINWQCRFCPYATLCRGENWEKEAKAILKNILKTGLTPTKKLKEKVEPEKIEITKEESRKESKEVLNFQVL